MIADEMEELRAVGEDLKVQKRALEVGKGAGRRTVGEGAGREGERRKCVHWKSEGRRAVASSGGG